MTDLLCGFIYNCHPHCRPRSDLLHPLRFPWRKPDVALFLPAALWQDIPAVIGALGAPRFSAP